MKSEIILLVILIMALVVSGCCCCTSTSTYGNDPTVSPSKSSKPTQETQKLPTVVATPIKTAAGHNSTLDALSKEYKNLLNDNYDLKTYSLSWWDSTNTKMKIGLDWPTDTASIMVNYKEKTTPSKDYSGFVYILVFNDSEEANAFIYSNTKWHGYSMNDLMSVQSITGTYEPVSGYNLYERTMGHKSNTIKAYSYSKDLTKFSKSIVHFVQADNIVIESEILEMSV